MTATDSMAEVRAKRKRKISPFNSSPYRDAYVRLIQAGWSSTALERYAKYRYDEVIPASTFRNHMRKIEKAEPLAIIGKSGAALGDLDIDVMGIRQQLITLQVQRLGVDANHEFQMNKLFGSTREEIKLLSTLLNEAKADQRDYGVIVHDPSEELPPVPVPEAKNSPKHTTVQALLGLESGQDPLALAEGFAKVININRTA